MAKTRKIKCDCGDFLIDRKTIFNGIETNALICPKCHFLTLTKEQAEEYVRLKQLHQIVDAERKIIKIGNSMGLTLPDKLQDFGIKIGAKVKTTATSSNSFKVEMSRTAVLKGEACS